MRYAMCLANGRPNSKQRPRSERDGQRVRFSMRDHIDWSSSAEIEGRPELEFNKCAWQF